MTWLAWLGLAVLITAVAAVTGIKPKGTRHVAGTRLMGVARVALLIFVVVILMFLPQVRQGAWHGDEPHKISETYFFRHRPYFDLLEREIVPRLIAERRETRQLRIWSAGCATGEEAYSLAILFAEVLGDRFADVPVKVFATDVDLAAVAAARRGVYTDHAVAGLPRTTRERWFTRTSEGWTVKKEIRWSSAYTARR